MFPSKSYDLRLDGKHVAYVDNKRDYEKVILDLQKEEKEKTKLDIKGIANKVTVTEVTNGKKETIDQEELKKALSESLDWKVDAVAININEKPQVYLPDKDTAEKVIKAIKFAYIPDGEKLDEVSVDFEENVEIKNSEAKVSQLMDDVKAATFIAQGTDKIKKHTIAKGDNLWDIAHANDMTVTELRDANPQLKNDFLGIGDELNLVKQEPLVNIVTSYKATEEEKVKYDTEYIKANDLWRGQSKVKTPGKDGKREVTYKLVYKNGVEVEKQLLQEKILEEPTTKVVYEGTKLMIASRGGGGTGQLAWPIRGKITSGYGFRRLGFHTGIDIDGNTGDPIYAAEAGRVVRASWAGSYGYCVDIDHGDGVLTRYAHQSQILVKVGQQVRRGSLIGKVGSTGRSTGSHLHFEVRINNKHTNPLKYLR